MEAVDGPLAEEVKLMCAFDPERRPTIEQVIEVVETRLAQVRRAHAANVSAIYPFVANRFRWSEGLHEALTEREVLVFLRGNRLDRDAEFLSEKLIDFRLFGYSIFRLLGASDYLLRVWRRDADRSKLREVLEQYRIHCGDYEIVEPNLRWPTHRRAGELAALKPGQVYDLLHGLVVDTSDAAVAIARRNGVIVGVSKAVREHAKARRAIRAICRIVLRSRVSREIAPVLGERLFKAISKRHFREVELLSNPSPSQAAGEFIIMVEFTDFHVYRDLLEAVGKVLAAFEKDAEIRSMFEMDSATRLESYDGGMLHELHQRRPSRRLALEGSEVAP
jgi:hypothetical protein